MPNPKFKRGDYVVKLKGYTWPGRITSVTTLDDGSLRYLVARWPDYKCVHIFSENQLELSTAEQAVDHSALTTRTKLPDRRLTASFDLRHTMTHSHWIVSIGFYHNGTSGTGDIGEVFIESELDTAADSGLLARDAAILISIALQYGVPIDVLAEAVSRTQQENGQPQTIIGSALDALRDHGPLVEKQAAE